MRFFFHQLYLDFCWIFGGVLLSSNSIIASSLLPPKGLEVLHWSTEVIWYWLSDNWVADSCPNDRWSSTLTTSEVSWPARGCDSSWLGWWVAGRSADKRPLKLRLVGSTLENKWRCLSNWCLFVICSLIKLRAAPLKWMASHVSRRGQAKEGWLFRQNFGWWINTIFK